MFLGWIALLISFISIFFYFTGIVLSVNSSVGNSDNSEFLIFSLIFFITSICAFFSDYEKNKKIKMELAISFAIEQGNVVHLLRALDTYKSSRFFDKTMLIKFRFQAEEAGQERQVKIFSELIQSIGL
ncbi:hypothetical protein R6242_00335 [Iodobacter sp. CM08]|uniref:hypothetical protein n=1 Tax=Iodobacter sp. CM08 TaxID=3085902 RepID=UPI00298229C5|nr:hypothetical protein [Iodobacter sp. CM08]MDW5415021.1 hypothetical protein [Iodobacter sp. CM08]